MRTTTAAMLLPLFLVLAAPAGRADPPPVAAHRTAADHFFRQIQDRTVGTMPDRERDLIQIIEDARSDADKTHSYKNARMGMQIRIQTFYDKNPEFENWQGTVDGTYVLPGDDVWINIRIGDGITVGTSPTKADDPSYVTLIKGGTKLADIAATLRNGQRVQFSATLLRFVIDQDEAMLHTPRMLAHFSAIKPLN